MSYFFWLMIIYIIYAVSAFVIFNAKLLSPSFIFSMSFTFMICLAYIFKDLLKFEVSRLTFLIFVTAGFLFLVTEFIVMVFYNRKKTKINNVQFLEFKNKKILVISNPIQQLMIAFLVLSLMIAIMIIYINTDAGTLGTCMGQYKNAMLYNAESIKYRFYVSQLYKINTCIAYLCAYIMIYNYTMFQIKLKNQKRYLIIIGIFCAFSMIAQAARQPMIEIILYLPIVYVSLMMKPRDRKNIKKLVTRSIPLLLIAVFIFYYTSTLVGRRKTERGIWEYLAVYFCGGLYSFNLHISEPARTIYWGQSSFADIYNVLIKLGVISSEANMQYHDFELYGNTVTLFGRWYEDFGQAGVYIMTILISLFFSIFFYRRVVPARNKYKEHHLSRLLYCKFVISLIWAGYDDRIRALLSFQTLVFYILVSFMFWCFVSRKIKLKLR